MSKKNKGEKSQIETEELIIESNEQSQEESTEGIKIEATEIEAKAEDKKDEDVIIYADKVVTIEDIKASVEHEPVGNIDEIGDNDMVLVQRLNYVATCRKAWAIDRNYEIVGRVK